MDIRRTLMLQTAMDIRRTLMLQMVLVILKPGSQGNSRQRTEDHDKRYQN